MKVEYSPAANDEFFSQVLPCSLRPCPFDVYMNLTESSSNIKDISIHTIGPQLVISGYTFPGSAIKHVLHFNTDYSVQTPSITINSNVIGNDIVLNPFMLLKQPQDKIIYQLSKLVTGEMVVLKGTLLMYHFHYLVLDLHLLLVLTTIMVYPFMQMLYYLTHTKLI